MLEVEIHVKGHINKDWSNRFGDLTVTHENDGSTTLTGSIRDQSELRGVLSSLANLGLDLISVKTKNNGKTSMSREGGDRLKKRRKK